MRVSHSLAGSSFEQTSSLPPAPYATVGAPGIVRLYGELFGGAYPHPSVIRVPGASPVQTGIWYAPDIRFVLFDIIIGSDAGEADEFLSHAEVETLGAAHSLLVVPLLGRGQRQALEGLPVRFPTRIPACLGLPSLPDNMAEGLVMKPDARALATARFVVKRKIQEFDEARFDESTPWGLRGGTRPALVSTTGVAIGQWSTDRLPAQRWGPLHRSSKRKLCSMFLSTSKPHSPPHFER